MSGLFEEASSSPREANTGVLDVVELFAGVADACFARVSYMVTRCVSVGGDLRL